MNIDIAALRGVAEAAIQDSWVAKSSEVRGERGDFVSDSWDEDSAAHIAAFDPPTVLALLDQLEELQWRLDGLDK